MSVVLVSACQVIVGLGDRTAGSPSGGAPGSAGSTSGVGPQGPGGREGSGGMAGSSGAGPAGSGGTSGEGGTDGNDGNVGAACDDARTCHDGLVCIFGSCRESCDSDGECPSGSVCVGTDSSFGCSLPAERECGAASPCPPPLVCGPDRKCRAGCTSEADCPRNEHACITGVCVSRTDPDDRWFACNDGDVVCENYLTGENCSGCPAPIGCRRRLGCRLAGLDWGLVETCDEVCSYTVLPTAGNAHCGSRNCGAGGAGAGAGGAGGASGAAGIGGNGAGAGGAPTCEPADGRGPMMKPVPSATSFVIGSPEFNDAPEHTVDFAAFDVDMTEVTTADYGACVQAGCCTPPATGGLCNYGVSAKDEHPVNCVDWYQADAYCGWANKRLPTEEEWEYVARRPDGRAYPWGAPAPVLGTGQQLCFSQSGTCSVNAFPLGTTEDGVLDMAGNVWEWTATQYCGAYGSNVCATDNRAVRGGSYIDTDDVVFRGAYRYFNGAARGSRFENFGFRCVR